VGDAFVVKDSGQRQEFASGMVRDVVTDKVDFELVFNGPMLARWADHLTKGARKYPDVRPGVPNWTLAEGEAELVRARKSAARHFVQWLRGDTDEDHAAAVYFNINLAEYVKDRMAREIDAENEAMYRELIRPNFEVERVPDHELPQTCARGDEPSVAFPMTDADRAESERLLDSRFNR